MSFISPGTVAIIAPGGNSESEVVIGTRNEPLVPSAVFSPPVSGTGQDKTVIEVSSPQAGMVLGVVLGSLVVLGLAIGVSAPSLLFPIISLPPFTCPLLWQSLLSFLYHHLCFALSPFNPLSVSTQMFVGYVKMRRRVIIHTRFPNPVYRKTTGMEEGGSGYTIEQDGIMFVQQDYDYSDPQNKVLIDSDDVSIVPISALLSPLFDTLLHVISLSFCSYSDDVRQ